MNLPHQHGDVINQKYRVLDTLGQGGIGITYLTQNIETSENLALKVLSLRRVTDWKKIELFKRESQILSQLSHSAIPQYIDYFQIETSKDNSFYIAQQLAPGKSLSELIENGWYPDESKVKDIAIQILNILIYLHSFSPPVIHRDIKPQNIICDKNGNVFLVDFGAVAETYHNTVTGGSTVVGTFGYMAPEQFRGQAFPSTDLYALGTTLLYLLTKKHPSDLRQKHLKIDFRSQITASRNFANWLDTIIEPVAENRFPDAEIALAVLQGKESLDKYFVYKAQKPKDSTISLQKGKKKLQIDIPAGKLHINFSLALGMLMFLCNGILLFILISLVVLNSVSFNNWLLNYIGKFFGTFFLFGSLLAEFAIFCHFVINPLSRIKLTILKKNNNHIFVCQKWLLFLRYQNFEGEVYKKQFQKTLKSIKSNLTAKEYRWLKSEINQLVKDKSIM